MKKVFLQKGFTLVETLVGVTVFLIVSISVYNGFLGALNALKVLQIKNSALQIASEQIEIVRNLAYQDIGIINGLPNGILEREKTESRNNLKFNVVTTIKNIDLEFDGIIGGTPNDTSPADNKLVEVEVTCENCKYTSPTILTAQIAPKNLESQGQNGALFIRVVDSAGSPVQGAEILVQNVSAGSNLSITDETGVNGLLQLVDTPTGTNAYSVQITKDGYSTDKTYSLTDPSNPDPTLPHANVLQGLVTQLSFVIDKLSYVKFSSRKTDCSMVSGINFNLKGDKMIGENTYKYNQDLITNISGELVLNSVEWDSYNLSLNDADYYLAGTNPMLPLSIEPDSIENVDIIVEEKNGNALLINIRDEGNELPISDAVVTINKNSTKEEKTTGRGYFYQTDWSGGTGQLDFSDFTKYYADNNYLERNLPQGEIKIIKMGDDYFTQADLTSSIIDVGTTSNFSNISWAPYDQNVLAGSESVRVQFATNLENTSTTTWDFVGPDGTDTSYYTVSGESINSQHDGDRFARYKIFMNTADQSVSPILSDFAFTYASDCVPPGQVYFDGLSAGDYQVTVEKDGYQTLNTNVSVVTGWQVFNIDLTP